MHTTSVKLFSHQFPTWYYSLADVHKVKEVAIGFRRGTSFILDSMVSDPLGRYLFLRGSLGGGMPCTLATLYSPNRDQASFIDSTLTKLTDFAQGCVLLAGDFNLPIDPLLLNLDAKLYAKVIANRLLPLIPKWVSCEQTGFIPGREQGTSLSIPFL